MSFTNLTVRRIDEVEIIDLHGCLLRNEEYQALETLIRRLVEAGSRRILINMGETNIITKSQAWPLVQMCIDTAKAGGKAKLLNVGQAVRTILQTTGLYEIFEADENEESAVRSMSAYAIPQSTPGSEYFIG